MFCIFDLFIRCFTLWPVAAALFLFSPWSCLCSVLSSFEIPHAEEAAGCLASRLVMCSVVDVLIRSSYLNPHSMGDRQRFVIVAFLIVHSVEYRRVPGSSHLHTTDTYVLPRIGIRLALILLCFQRIPIFRYMRTTAVVFQSIFLLI